MDVALFVTCLTDTFFPRVGVAIVRVLRHFGCTVHFPRQQTCCGQAAYNNGFHAEAGAMGRRFIDVFERYEHVVTPSASCASMVTRHLPELLADDPGFGDRARRLAERTCEFGTFLTDILQVDVSTIMARDPRATTFHYGCHARGLRTPEQASGPVRSLCAADYRPLEDPDQCCGFGGAFGVLYPAISDAMARDKVAAIQRSGAGVVVSNEAGCTITLAGTARRLGIPVTFKHLAELMAESLGLMDDFP